MKKYLKKKKNEALAWLGKAKKLFNGIKKNEKMDAVIRNYVESTVLEELNELEVNLRND